MSEQIAQISLYKKKFVTRPALPIHLEADGGVSLGEANLCNFLMSKLSISQERSRLQQIKTKTTKTKRALRHSQMNFLYLEQNERTVELGELLEIMENVVMRINWKLVAL